MRAARQSQPLVLLYEAPAVVMLCLHAVVANEHTRYNLVLIGPFSVGADHFEDAAERALAIAISRARIVMTSI